jgi:hypothetical protein
MKKILIILIVNLVYYNGFSQDNDIRKAKYVITKSYHDEVNMTKFEVDRGGVLVFEFTANKLSNFYNISMHDSTQSFGKVLDFKTDTAGNISNNDYEILSYFKWIFKNDYDSDSGTALIYFTEKISTYSTDFYLKLWIPKTKEIIEYWGYKEGTRKDLIPETKFK